MGSWGPDPWDNDGGADWFAELFLDGKIAERIKETFELDPLEYYEEIRAASYFLGVLGHVYVWPTPDVVPLVKKAVELLVEIHQARQLDESPKTLEKIEREIEVLKCRLVEVS